MDPILKLERLAQAKREDYLRSAETHRRRREAYRQGYGVRYQLAQALIHVATRLSPIHRSRLHTHSGSAVPRHNRRRPT